MDSIIVSENLVWERLDVNDAALLKNISRKLASFEKKSPQWFICLSLSMSGGTTAAIWRKFILRMDFVYVLKYQSRPVVCVFFENHDDPDKKEREIHLGSCRQIDTQSLTEALNVLKNELLKQGYLCFSGWVFSRHYRLMNLLTAIGFEYAGLRAYNGELKEIPAKWELMRLYNYRMQNL